MPAAETLLRGAHAAAGQRWTEGRANSAHSSEHRLCVGRRAPRGQWRFRGWGTSLGALAGPAGTRDWVSATAAEGTGHRHRQELSRPDGPEPARAERRAPEAPRMPRFLACRKLPAAGHLAPHYCGLFIHLANPVSLSWRSHRTTREAAAEAAPGRSAQGTGPVGREGAHRREWGRHGCTRQRKPG